MARRRSEPEVPKQRKVALAFAGPGDSTFDNTADLLDDFLGIVDGQVPDDDVLDLRIAFPITKEHLSKGLKSVVSWTDEYELAYDVFTLKGEKPTKAMDDVLNLAENNDISANVEKAVIDWLRDTADVAEGGWEAYLVLLWGEENADLDRANAEVLLDLATSLGIKALDLTAGLDDISFDEEPEEAVTEPEPEPEPVVEEKPKRSRRSRGRASEVTEEPKKAEEIGPTPEGEETLQETLATIVDEALPDEAQAILTSGFAGVSASITGKVSPLQSKGLGLVSISLASVIEEMKSLPESPELQQARLRAQEAAFWLSQAFNAAVGAADEFWADTPGVVTTGVSEAPQEDAEPAQEPEEAPKRGRGRPRTRSASERAVTEYYDEDSGTWERAGRGRPPKGAKTRKVDPDTGEEV